MVYSYNSTFQFIELDSIEQIEERLVEKYRVPASTSPSG